MWDLSKYLGDGVEALVTGNEQDFVFSESAEEGFTDCQKNFLFEAGIDGGKIFNIRQVHEAGVITVKEALSQNAETIPEADGVVTNCRGISLAVRTADCVPVFLYDPVRQSCGLIHAGWKSARQKILFQALKAMCQSYGTIPADLRVVFGPAIHSCCYQVGQEFCEIFPEQMVPRQGSWFLDLQEVNRRQLTDMGVREERIFDFGRCTCCDHRFFSFRRDGDRAGRQLSLIRMKDQVRE